MNELTYKESLYVKRQFDYVKKYVWHVSGRDFGKNRYFASGVCKVGKRFNVPDIEKCKRLADFYDVTIDSLLKTETDDKIGIIPPAPKGKNIWGSVTINERGQMVIPKAAREKFGWGGGQRLIVLSDNEGIALIPAETFEAKMKTVMEYASMTERNFKIGATLV